MCPEEIVELTGAGCIENINHMFFLADTSVSLLNKLCTSITVLK